MKSSYEYDSKKTTTERQKDAIEQIEIFKKIEEWNRANRKQMEEINNKQKTRIVNEVKNGNTKK